MRKKFTPLVLIYLVPALLLGAISYFRLLDNYELILLDRRFQSRPLQKIDPRIVIVEIGNDTLVNLGQWPLSRKYHASLIKVLSDCGVATVVFDVLFSEPGDADGLLAQATGQAACLYYPYALRLTGKQEGLWCADKFDAALLAGFAEAAKGTGHANILTDIDGKRRRLPLFIKYQGRLLPQLSLKAAADYLAIRPEEIKIFPRRFVQLGRFCRIPIDEEGANLVSLAGRWKDTFKHYSYGDILLTYAHKDPNQQFPPELAWLKDKVCFVGLTATGTVDINPSALERAYPMIGLHANLFNAILTKNFLRRLGRLPNLGILYLLCLLNLYLGAKTRPPLSVLLRIGLLGLFAGIGFLVFMGMGLWIDMFFPMLAYLSVDLGSSLFHYLNELRKRQLLEKELAIARDIQRSFLREVPPQLSGVSLAVTMETARHVGGDLYDVVQFADGRLGLMVGDVSGKGVPAALFMAQVISKFRHFARLSSQAAEMLTKLNRDISQESMSGLFVTMAYLIFDPATAEVDLASAGHLAPLVWRNSQLIEKKEVSEGIPMGLMAEASYSSTRFRLAAHELLLLYTDGVTEARDKKGREFTEAGMIRALQGKQGLSSAQLIRTIKDALDAFTGGAAQHDDITMMALKAS